VSTTLLLLGACGQQREPIQDAERAPPPAGKASGEPARAQLEFAAWDAEHRTGRPVQPAVAAVQRPAAALSVDRERYSEFESHGVSEVARQPVSTFSIDVDTASYANVRRMLNEGRLPRQDAVRVEELINYFAYADPGPDDRDTPFRVTAEVGPTPWNPQTRLLRIALKAWDMQRDELPPSNLVFLIDVSGSMDSAAKLPLLKRSIKLLTRRLRPEDRVTLVVYAGAAGVVLEPTAGDQAATIEAALDRLNAGGSTHGSAGIALAYAKAREAFIAGGINRVILATDGDFNVGTVDQRALLDLIERERSAGIALTTLGFGRGNLNDRLMEQLADHGNGNYAYIDSLLEANKVLVEQVGGTLLTVARDVKVQVEFNPARIAEYRLVGYENRALRREDFNNDRVDAGELGAGHSVVALYELGLVDGGGSLLEPLRYAGATAVAPSKARHDELAFVRLRYKAPDGGQSRLVELAVDDGLVHGRLQDASDDFRFAAAVAAFAQRLRGATYLNDFAYPDILALARAARGADPQGHRSDFLRLVGLAQSLDLRAPLTPGRQADDGNG
jgi:Ca-activated chloride channel family protein